MTVTQLAWAAIATGNLLLLIAGGLWWQVGWRWALLFLVAGPVVMCGLGVVALVLFFLLDGGLRTPALCAAQCGRPAPVQLRGHRYRRPYCDQCERQLERSARGEPPVDEVRL